MTDVGEAPPGFLRALLAAAFFARVDTVRETAVLGRAAQAEDVLPGAVHRVRELLAAASARQPLVHEVTTSAEEPGRLVASVGTGARRQHLAVQVVGPADLLLRDRIEALPAVRDRFTASAGPAATWCVLLAGDLTDHRVRQRVQSVHGRFAGDGALVVAPQHASAFLGLTPAEVDAVAAGVLSSWTPPAPDRDATDDLRSVLRRTACC